MKTIFVLLLHLATSHCEYNFKVPHGSIVGELNGFEVLNKGEFAYMARVQSIIDGVLDNGTEYMQTINCGGSIIRLNVILTAAHCIAASSPENIAVYAGSLNRNFQYYEPGLQISGVRRLVIHEDFNRTYMDSDIGLLFLENPLTKSKYVRTISLPTSWYYVPGVPVTVAGWGYDENGNSTEWLQKAYLVQFPRRLCQMYTNYTITERMMGAIDPLHIWTVCKGDSGGPLVVLNTVVGIVSWAIEGVSLPNNKTTCNAKIPSIFVNVLHFVPWIKKQIEDDSTLVTKDERIYVR